MRLRSLFALSLASLWLLGMTCDGDGVRFGAPLDGQLSLVGDFDWELPLPPFGIVTDLDLTLTHPDGSTSPVVPDSNDGQVAAGTLDLDDTGDYQIQADVRVRFLLFNLTLRDQVPFRLVELDSPDGCEVLNEVECLLPYPSSRFLVEDPSSDTGYRLDIPQVGIPQPRGTEISASLLNHLDGFSPTVQPLMHFPGGVDLVQSDVSRLQPPECCGQPGGPPWIATRTHTDRSRDADSPTLLIDYETGEKILHWVENDITAEQPRQVFIMRPAVSLIPGHKYIIAIRDLVAPDGSAVEAEDAFAALRDGTPTTIPAVEARRDEAEAMFAKLADHGVPRGDLILAFHFVVQSEHQLTHQMLTMRDKAVEWVDAQDQAAAQTFTVDSVEDFDCSAGGTHRRIVEGTYQSPLFLEAVPSDVNVPQVNADPVTDEPLMNGTMDAPFTISIPCVLLEEDGPDVHTMLLGHGIFGQGEGLVRGIPSGADAVLSQFADTARWNYISGATNWTGWSSADRVWVGTLIIGIVNSNLHNFPAFPDRHMQGQTNTIVLSRMMRRGDFNADPAFQLDLDGNESVEGVFPDAAEAEQYYYGISMGGVQGLFHAALSPDIEKFGIDVGSMNFSFLLQRSTQFPIFEELLRSVGLGERMELAIGLGLLHELWVAADPAGFATHITGDPLPGSGQASKVLMTPAWLDHQVSNHGSAATARTLGIPSLYGSIQQELVDIPDTAMGEAVDSAIVYYDTGLDILDPDHTPFIPPLGNAVVETSRCDPHGARPAIPAGIQQLITYMQPGGQIENFCNGLCDAGDPFEIRSGDSQVCDPL